ncbi:MAG TPA: 50S ribosomal protein L35 [Tepidisphaeraceae bacterium]|nr:50S ribosomal protein L35 [Tepidisphaeraceae bacterium]
MSYKYKPNKSVAKRFRVTKTGKVKHNHSFTSHLMSSRPAKRRRKLRRASVLHEGHARNMRLFMGLSKLKPKKIAHDRAVAARRETKEAAGTAA